MNTYNDNLQTTVASTLGQMQTQLKTLDSANTAAEYKLYFAQSANITANEQLEKVNAESITVGQMNAQGVENDNLAKNLLATVIKASTTVAASVTNASTTASNVQIAATAIAQLASDIGSAYNLVSAEDNNTDVYRMTSTANKLIRKTAYNAEYISQLAMEASEHTAEIQTSQLLAETSEVKSGIENLMTVTEAEFTRLTATKTVDTSNVDSTSSTEQQCEGALVDSQTEYSAIATAYDWTRTYLNYGLKIQSFTDNTVTVLFDAFVQPFKDSESKVATHIPAADPAYYLLLVPAKSADLLSVEKAELLFSEHKGRFYDVQPSTTGEEITLWHDSEGARIQAGATYVVFLFITLSQEYKKYINDYDDLLSAPSDSFTLSVPLAAADKFRQPTPPPTPKTPPGKTPVAPVTPPSDPGNVLLFTIDGAKIQGVEYRFMLLPLGTRRSRAFMTDDDPDQGDRLDFYFNLEIAEQITPANYVQASPSSLPDDSKPPSGLVYQVSIDQSMTDNFGNQLEPNHDYLPVVLSFAQESISPQYINVISIIKNAPVVHFDERFVMTIQTN